MKRYPEYINGIKQEQNPIRRLFIRYWYNDIFRVGVFVFPLWLLVLGVVLFAFGLLDHPMALPLFGALYLSGFLALCKWNNYSNLRRIGLDELGRPLEIVKENEE